MSIQTIVVSTDTQTRLNGNLLLSGRVIWTVIAAITIFLFIISLSPHYEELRTPAPDLQAAFGSFQLFEQDIALLNEINLSVDLYATLMLGLQLLISLISIGIGIIIFWRKSNDRMAILTSMLLILIGGFGRLTPVQNILVEMNPAWHIPVYAMTALYRVMLVAFFIVIPNGRFMPRWSRWWPLIVAFAHIPVVFFPDSPLNWQEWAPSAYLSVVGGSLGPAGAIMMYRYRRSFTAVERQQTKWIVLGFVLGFSLVIFPPIIAMLLLPALQMPGLLHVIFNILYQLMFVLAAILIPVVVGFSIFRHRLWEVDLVINRSLIYSAVTGVLALIFILSALILQQLFQIITGGMQSTVALIISTLTVGALFQPTQRQLRRFINRNLYHVMIDVDKIHSEESITHPGSLTGSMLGQYQVLEPVGRGGMGEVYRGYHAGLERNVAIKVLPPIFANEQEFKTRFQREARAVAGLRHPHIVDVFDFGYQNDISYMVMEFINGKELSALLSHGGRLPLEMASVLVSHIASALDYAHKQGLVHRDVKPSNIMLEQVENGKYPRAVLMDFGIARLVNSGTRVTGTGLLGTLDYVAPEQIAAAREVDHRADIYSLGITAYQMLTGVLPFKANDAAGVIFGHLYKPAPDPRELRPEVPAGTAEAVMKAMSKVPEERF